MNFDFRQLIGLLKDRISSYLDAKYHNKNRLLCLGKVLRRLWDFFNQFQTLQMVYCHISTEEVETFYIIILTLKTYLEQQFDRLKKIIKFYV